jgi:hypothetical protein
MPKFKNNKFLKFVSSLFTGVDKKNVTRSELNINEFNSGDLDDNSTILENVWKKEYNPLRQVLLWGWDEENNPSFLILYGKHEFKTRRSSGGNFLKDEVKYTSYAVFKGKEGHLPAFQAVKIIELYDYRSRSYTAPKLYYKKGLSTGWYGRGNDEYLVKGFKNLAPENQVSFPYCISQSHSQCVRKLVNRPRLFHGFTLANNPNEVLKIEGELANYSEIILELMSHHNIYIRKKRLNELISMKPPKEVFTRLLDIGSTETVSGLFQELAKMADPVLIEEAKVMLETGIKWADGNYAKGVKRCIKIYLNTLDEKLKVDRAKWIRKYLSQMDLHLISINGKDIPQGKILEGSAYRKYAVSGLLQDYFWKYDYKTRKSSKFEAVKRYESGLYTDGVRLKIIDFKNTIQEAEIYGLEDVLGKIAYYLDAPRVTYYLKGSNKGKTLKYFRRYIKRILNSYAEKEPDKFMEAMKYMLTSYTEHDYVCKFRNNFQFNELLKYYLYYDFKEKPPVGWENWNERYEWMTNDQLMRLEGRYEFMREIWDNHLEIVADIALGAQINQVKKACYYILKDSLKSAEFIENMSYRQLINLALITYEPLAEMFMNILINKLQQLNAFDSKLMVCLIGSADKRMHDAAVEFFKRTNGLFSPADAVDLLFLDNLQQWSDLFQQNLLSLEREHYIEFISQILNKSSQFLELKIDLPENIRDILTVSTNKIEELSEDEKVNLINHLIGVLLKGEKLPEWMGTFIEEVIFSVSYEDLKSLLSETIIKPLQGWTASRNKRIISVLEAIKNKNIPCDVHIIDILDSGTSKMIKILFDIITENREELKNRFSTSLIFFESEVTVLNEIAEEIFESMQSEKQKKLHAMIINSPVVKAYSFGLKKLDMLYGDAIPEEFILQMLEHSSSEVKAYISDKTNRILDNLGNGNEKLFMYYVKTLLLLPNRNSKSKDKVYEVIPKFAIKFRDYLDEIEGVLLDIGGSNSIIDSERALVALAKIRGEVVLRES